MALYWYRRYASSFKRHNPTNIIIQHLPPTWLHIDLWFFIPPENFITVLVINSKMIRAILSSIWIEIHLVHCIIGCPNITPWKKLVTKNAKSTCIVEFQSIIHALLCSGIYVWYYMFIFLLLCTDILFPKLVSSLE